MSVEKDISCPRTKITKKVSEGSKIKREIFFTSSSNFPSIWGKETRDGGEVSKTMQGEEDPNLYFSNLSSIYFWGESLQEVCCGWMVHAKHTWEFG